MIFSLANLFQKIHFEEVKDLEEGSNALLEKKGKIIYDSYEFFKLIGSETTRHFAAFMFYIFAVDPQAQELFKKHITQTFITTERGAAGTGGAEA